MILACAVCSCHRQEQTKEKADVKLEMIEWSQGAPSPPKFTKIGEDNLPGIRIYSYAGNGNFTEVINYISEFLGKDWALRNSDDKTAIFIKRQPHTSEVLLFGLGYSAMPDQSLGEFLLVMNVTCSAE